MGKISSPAPVKLIMGVLARNQEILEKSKSDCSRILGPVDLSSEVIPFEFTTYYEEEMGAGLLRQWVSFEPLVDPAELPAIKHRTSNLEVGCAVEGKRTVNLDPGYLTESRVVLASTKDFAHRLYLGKGIYGELTLTYARGIFLPLEWTYPDYRILTATDFFQKVRARYREQLKAVQVS